MKDHWKIQKQGALGNYFCLKYFQNLLHSKFHKLAEKLNFMIFRDIYNIILKNISSKDDIWQVETPPEVFLEERKLNILK